MIVAGDPLARAGIAALLTAHLAEQDGGCVVGQIADDDDLLARLDVYRPDVLVWDLGWDSEPDTARLVDFTSDGSPPVVALLPGDEAARAVWMAGARGLLPRHAGPDVIHAALVAVAQGLAVCDPALMTALPLAASDPLVDDLTVRELDVLRLLAEGLSNRAIAQRLGISEHTVKFHINAILGKLRAQSRTEAVVSAIRAGVINV